MMKANEMFMYSIAINILLSVVANSIETYCLIHLKDSELNMTVRLLLLLTNVLSGFMFSIATLIYIRVKKLQRAKSTQTRVITFRTKNRNRPPILQPTPQPQDPDFPQPVPVHRSTRVLHPNCISKMFI